jgi:ribosomal protein S18 acetylase RimI-like enzyme
MAVLLKNLVARSPRGEDLVDISELIVLCENTQHNMADSSLEDLLSHWQQPDFHLAEDAWVIVTTRGQIVGLASVWHKNYTHISTFLCVHPEYRNRGIGTVLLRLVEVRARQHLKHAPSDARVVLSGLISRANEGAQHLFEREGYQLGQRFLRIAFVLVEDTCGLHGSWVSSSARIDVELEQGQVLTVTPLAERDGLCTVCQYKTYEKELRPAINRAVNGGEITVEILDTLVSMH